MRNQREIIVINSQKISTDNKQSEYRLRKQNQKVIIENIQRKQKEKKDWKNKRLKEK